MIQLPISELIRRAHQVMTAEYMRQEPPLTLPQVIVMRSLVQHGIITQTRITELTGVDRSTLGTMVKTLGDKLYVVLDVPEEDRRATLVATTAAGRKALVEADKALVRAELAVTGMVPRAARAAFRQALQAIAGRA